MWPQVLAKAKSLEVVGGIFFQVMAMQHIGMARQLLWSSQQKTIAGRGEGPQNLNSQGLLVPESSHVEGQALPGLAKTRDETLIFLNFFGGNKIFSLMQKGAFMYFQFSPWRVWGEIGWKAPTAIIPPLGSDRILGWTWDACNPTYATVHFN